MGSSRHAAVISAVTVMEILIRPLRQTPRKHHTVLGFLHAQPHMSLVPVDVQAAQDAAHLRAGRRMNAPDALVVGTGLATQVRHLVTNDRAWGPKLAPMANRIGVVVSDILAGADTLVANGPAGGQRASSGELAAGPAIGGRRGRRAGAADVARVRRQGRARGTPRRAPRDASAAPPARVRAPPRPTAARRARSPRRSSPSR